MPSPFEFAPRPLTSLLALASIIAWRGAFGDDPMRQAADDIAKHCGPGRARIAVIGDFGTGDATARAVADLVKSWNVQIIVTVGDNNYPTGSVESFERNVTHLYGEFLGRADGTPNRFFPALGNHDWMDPDKSGLPAPHLNFFALPGNERYYRHVQGDVELFVVDSDSREPDGITADSVQAQWLRRALAESTAAWKWVVMHHAPFSSSAVHGSHPKLQWPFRQWGADVVFSGHDHSYERLEIDGLPYMVNGLGGAKRYFFLGDGIPGSKKRFSKQHGAVLTCTSSDAAWLAFITVDGGLVDQFELNKRLPVGGDAP